MTTKDELAILQCILKMHIFEGRRGFLDGNLAYIESLSDGTFHAYPVNTQRTH